VADRDILNELIYLSDKVIHLAGFYCSANVSLQVMNRSPDDASRR